jgi:uncharacterized tellurite resistance protein B-like protein
MMSLLNGYSQDQKIACIAYLYLVNQENSDANLEETSLIGMLATHVGVSYVDLENMTELQLRNHLQSFSHDQAVECLRMGYSLMRLDSKNDSKELKVLKLFADMHHIEIKSYQHFYKHLGTVEDLTALDKIILIALGFHMVEADGVINRSKIQILIVICNMMGLSPEEVKELKIPFKSLFKAVKTMSEPSVRRIIEELVTIALSDSRITTQEYDIVLPILSEFSYDFEDMVKAAEIRLEYNREYYDLYASKTTVN